MNKIKVLIVDDSAIVRKILTGIISAESDMEVVGTAPDPFIARDKILALQPDVLTLDIEMPRMDGLTFLRKLMQHHPLPVIIISSLSGPSSHAAFEALRSGAIDVLAKPDGPLSVGQLRMTLATMIRAASTALVRPADSEPAAPLSVGSLKPDRVIAIGASTGGIHAIQEILTRLPENSPGIVIAQHLPPVFSAAFARRLDRLCSITVKEASAGDELVPGLALIAPGNLHMTLHKSGTGYRVEVNDGPPVCYVRPSVDVLFNSVAEAAGPKAIGVLLTGMGSDGAQGLLRMKLAGARTIAQDKATSVVFGMPGEAIRLGAAERVLPLSEIPSAIFATSPSPDGTPPPVPRNNAASPVLGPRSLHLPARRALLDFQPAAARSPTVLLPSAAQTFPSRERPPTSPAASGSSRTGCADLPSKPATQGPS
jgi:two-component system chemotaxis response regulator CheB